MKHLARLIVNDLTTVSVIISLVTYYLAVNKTWQVKHEKPVAASISILSYGLYLLTTMFFGLNMLMTSAPWQSMAETLMSLMNSFFLLAVGLSIWVPGEQQKGFFRLLVESLRSERQHLGALAKVLTHPSGSKKIIEILTHLAVVDGVLDAKEKSFIKVFADSWGIDIDWDEVACRGQIATEQQYAQLRRDVEAYLDVLPPAPQALQLADLVTRLASADERMPERKALISSEIGALLEQYGGKREKIVYEVHIVPQSAAQDVAMTTAFPEIKRRVLPSGPVGVAATCYSAQYAELVRDQYARLTFYTAVTRVEAT